MFEAIGAVNNVAPAAAITSPAIRSFLKNGGVSCPHLLKKDFSLSLNFTPLFFELFISSILLDFNNAQRVKRSILQGVLISIHLLEKLDH